MTWADLQPESAQIPSRVAVRVAIAAGHTGHGLSGQSAVPIRSAASRVVALLTWGVHLGDLDVSVTEDLLNDSQMHVLTDQQGACGVSSVVQSDVRESSSGQDGRPLVPGLRVALIAERRVGPGSRWPAPW